MRQQRADDLDDMITATGTAFLGLTVNCARCHDHKFDPITQKDYYGLQAVFAGVEHADAVDRRGRRRRAAGPRRPRSPAELAAGRASSSTRSSRLARPDARRGRPADGQPPPQRRAVRPGRRPVRPLHDPRDRNHGRALHRRAGGLHRRATSPRNVALASAGGKASASSEYPGAAIHKIAHLNDGRSATAGAGSRREPGRGRVTIELAAGRRRSTASSGAATARGSTATAWPTDYYIEVRPKPGEWRVVASSVDRVPFRPDAGRGPRSPRA